MVDSDFDAKFCRKPTKIFVKKPLNMKANSKTSKEITILDTLMPSNP